MSTGGGVAAGMNRHAMILGVLGIIVLVVGIAIVAIPSAPMRGSGLGTLAIVAGLVLLFIAYLRLRHKRPQ